MKTVFIDASPKKKLSASGFIAGMTRFFTSGKKVLCKLRTPADYQSVQEQIQDADSVVFSMPLYVDGVPSHVLPFLKELEAAYKGTSSGKRIYVIANNGFIEGRQTFIFILFADLFFTVTSLFQGGMFRGWLSRK